VARQWLGVAGAGTGHPYRQALAAWPAIVDAFARAHAGDPPPPTVVALAGDGGQPRPTTVALSRWVPRGGRGGAFALLTPVAGDETAPAAAGQGAEDTVARLASGLAHEIANSLTTVHGYAHLIDRATLTAQDKSAIDLIRAGSEKMLQTVEAFRNLVRPLPLSPTVFAPADAVQAAIALARQEAGQPNVPVQVTIAPCGTVVGDRVLLEEAIAAVVRNALEASALATPSPAVDIRVGQALGAGRAEIVVSDRGPGIPEDLRAKVFQPFLTDKPGHEGLGLARAAHVLRAHPGASIALDHPPIGGLAVTIRLPLSA
jgi:signal transduction histidine kinase